MNIDEARYLYDQLAVICPIMVHCTGNDSYHCSYCFCSLPFQLPLQLSEATCVTSTVGGMWLPAASMTEHERKKDWKYVCDSKQTLVHHLFPLATEEWQICDSQITLWHCFMLHSSKIWCFQWRTISFWWRSNENTASSRCISVML